ncbi:MAG: divalent-cation tolerance protein CutA [Nitrospira defluvii]|nr:divalent-cation tolerance protein CutA [Nitrospira defluvii]
MEASVSEIVVLVTASSADEAEQLGSMVVSSGLAACANVVKGIQSIFRWDNKINVENECLIIIKTTLDRFSELEAVIRGHHSYSVPEIIALPIIRGSAQYLEWIKAETHK